MVEHPLQLSPIIFSGKCLTKEVKKDIKVTSVNHMDEVISHAIISSEPILQDIIIPDLPVDVDISSNEKPLNLSWLLPLPG